MYSLLDVSDLDNGEQSVNAGIEGQIEAVDGNRTMQVVIELGS